MNVDPTQERSHIRREGDHLCPGHILSTPSAAARRFQFYVKTGNKHPLLVSLANLNLCPFVAVFTIQVPLSHLQTRNMHHSAGKRNVIPSLSNGGERFQSITRKERRVYPGHTALLSAMSFFLIYFRSNFLLSCKN